MEPRLPCPPPPTFHMLGFQVSLPSDPAWKGSPLAHTSLSLPVPTRLSTVFVSSSVAPVTCAHFWSVGRFFLPAAPGQQWTVFLGTYPRDESLTAARGEEALPALLVCACACASDCVLFTYFTRSITCVCVCAALSPVTAHQAPALSPFCPFVTMTSAGHPQQLLFFP